MRYAAFIIIGMTIAQVASAQGTTLANGRYPGEVTEFTLTAEQAKFIELWSGCKHDNAYSPYVFRLTASQLAELKRRTGLAPTRFAIIDSHRGATGDELGVNVVNRFAVDKFEIPHKPLISEPRARKWESTTMGWKPSPYLRSGSMVTGKCLEER